MSPVLSSIGAAALESEVRKFLRRWAERDARDLGEWRGKAEYRKLSPAEAEKLGYPKTSADVYLLTSDEKDPLRFFSYRTKLEYRTRLSLVTDFGSIPELAQLLGTPLELEPERFWRSYQWHDGTYEDGGVWVRDPSNPASIWVFVPCTRAQCDVFLFWGLSAEGANNATLQAVYRAVRIGAGIPWRRHRNSPLDPAGPGC